MRHRDVMPVLTGRPKGMMSCIHSQQFHVLAEQTHLELILTDLVGLKAAMSIILCDLASTPCMELTLSDLVGPTRPIRMSSCMQYSPGHTMQAISRIPMPRRSAPCSQPQSCAEGMTA